MFWFLTEAEIDERDRLRRDVEDADRAKTAAQDRLREFEERIKASRPALLDECETAPEIAAMLDSKAK